jgi:pyruvate ferredoxin oxidoreductase beta subunit
VETAYRVLRRKGKISQEMVFVVFAGDGGTYDIGFQALSGALERGHRFVYICYDNEAYMNTGNQRSAATPQGASTTTTPVGTQSSGKIQRRKELTEIAIAHHIPYAAQASISDWQDLVTKVERAVQMNGPSFLNVLSTCTRGWGFPPEKAVSMAQLAVQTCYWPLYEVVEDAWSLTYEPEPRTPEERAKWGRYGLDITEWLKLQGRFGHLFQRENGQLFVRPEHKELVAEIQRQVERDWEKLLARCDRSGRMSV